MPATDTAMPDFDDLWDYNQPAATEARFRALLPQGSAQPARHAELLTQVARAQGLQRRFDEAHATLDTAQALLTDQPANATVRAQIRYLLERGRVFNSSGQRAAAHPLFVAAWQLAQQASEDFYAIDAAHMLGAIEAPTGDSISDQQRWNLLALRLTEQTPDARAKKWLGSLCNNIGWRYFEQDDYTTALAYFTKALAAREAQGDVGAQRIARWCIAKTRRMLGQVAEALSMQHQLLGELQADGATDGYVYEELGEGYLQQGDPDKAAPFFALAHQVLAQDDWLVANEAARLARLEMLGQEPQ